MRRTPLDDGIVLLIFLFDKQPAFGSERLEILRFTPGSLDWDANR
jgi:hypothetical protein